MDNYASKVEEDTAALAGASAPVDESSPAGTSQDDQLFYKRKEGDDETAYPSEPPPSYFPPDGLNFPGPSAAYHRGLDADPNGEPTTIIVIQQPAPSDLVPVTSSSFCCYYALSCITCWLCFFVFGIIAFILTGFASKSHEDRKIRKSEQLSSAAIALSVIGIIVGCAVWGFIIWMCVEFWSWFYCGDWRYRFRQVMPQSQCYAMYGDDVCWNDGYCFY